MPGIYKLKDDFELWVKNPHLLNKRTEPGYTDEYEHPWTVGAWAAWRACAERAKPIVADKKITREEWENACNGLGGGA